MSSPHPQEWTIAVSRGRMFAFGPRVSEPTEVVPKSSRDRMEEALRAYVEAADWYRRCLEDVHVQDRRPVRGLGEAKHAYDKALIRAREALASVGDEGERHG